MLTNSSVIAEHRTGVVNPENPGHVVRCRPC